MEGNLRGARDLVAPLTAANLRRATSVGTYAPPPASFGGRNRYVQDAYHHDAAGQPYRTLQTQASSPTMARDFQGHWRGFSETELPERTYTALDDRSSPIIAQGYIPTKAHDPSWTKTLKGSRSHDSLGHLALRRPGSRDPFWYSRFPFFYAKGPKIRRFEKYSHSVRLATHACIMNPPVQIRLRYFECR